jgi:glutamate synthase domain-containing protein 2
MTLHNMLGDLSTDEAVDWLAQLVQHLGVLSAVRAPDGTLRVAIASGTVTTVSTVTNQAQAGGMSLAAQVQQAHNTLAQVANVAQIIVT